MLRIAPVHVHAAPNSEAEAHLRLMFLDRPGCVNMVISLDQAQRVACELHGVGKHQADGPELALAMVRALNADITRVVLVAAPTGEPGIGGEHAWGYLSARLHLQTGSGLQEIEVDVVTGLILAMRLQVQIWLDGISSSHPRQPDENQHSAGVERFCATPIPLAFEEALTDLWPFP